jgi:hypothetical protein
MERHVCVPRNVHDSALDLQALQIILHDAGVIAIAEKIGLPTRKLQKDTSLHLVMGQTKTRKLLLT